MTKKNRSHKKWKDLSFCILTLTPTTENAVACMSSHCLAVWLHIRHHAQDVLLRSSEYEQIGRQWRRQALPYFFPDHNAATHLHFDGDVLNSSESSAQTQLGNPPSLFAVLLLTHWLLTENVIHNGEMVQDAAVFSGSLLWQFTQLERRLYYQKMTLWNPLKKGVVWCPVSPETEFFILKIVRQRFKVVNDGEITFLHIRSCLDLTVLVLYLELKFHPLS